MWDSWKRYCEGRMRNLRDKKSILLLGMIVFEFYVYIENSSVMYGFVVFFLFIYMSLDNWVVFIFRGIFLNIYVCFYVNVYFLIFSV